MKNPFRQLEQIIERLDRIDEKLGLLEAVGESGPSGCEHVHRTDISTMGNPPGSRYLCQDCGEIVCAGGNGEA